MSMNPTAEQLKEAVLCLPERERQDLVEELTASLSTGPEIEAAWDAEIQRRMEDFDAGRVEGIPAEEALRRLDKLLAEDSEVTEELDEETERLFDAYLADEREAFPGDKVILKARARVERRAAVQRRPD
jgi:putative addiction module component (TIGR02574 family)